MYPINRRDGELQNLAAINRRLTDTIEQLKIELHVAENTIKQLRAEVARHGEEDE